MKKYKREKLIVSIFAVIFVVIVVILGNFLVTYISSDLSFGQNCLLRIPFYGTLVFTSSLIGLLFRNDSKKDIVEENSKEVLESFFINRSFRRKYSISGNTESIN